MNETKESDHFDLNVFKEIGSSHECDGDTTKCRSLLRIKYALSYYHLLLSSPTATDHIENPRDLFMDFCVEAYSKKLLLSDYVHFICKHSDNESRRSIVNDLNLKCPKMDECGWTQRHFGDRNEEQTQSENTSNLLVDTFDSIHFHLLHLEDAGLRVDDHGVDDDDDEKTVDLETKRIAKVIDAKRANRRFERLDGPNNAKFNIMVGQTAKEENSKGTHTHTLFVYIS